MKKYLLLLIITSTCVMAQDTTKVQTKRWTIEVLAGMTKGITPFSPGYASAESTKYFGNITPSSYEINIRYNFQSNLATRFGLSYQEFQNAKNSPSFNTSQYSFKSEVMYDLMTLFMTDFKKIKLHLHTGLKIDYFENNNALKNRKEWNGGVVFGIMPEFILFDNFSLLIDVTVQKNVRQHLTWDGNPSPSSSNLYGELITSSLGLAYQFGKKEVKKTTAELQQIERYEKVDKIRKRIDGLETNMNDMDKDGVADYLDEENNSVAGVAVDSRGRMVDLNRNGVPDEIEKQMEEKVTSNNKIERIEITEKLIKEGYIYAKFKKANTKPEDNSTSALDFVRTHLKNNLTTRIKIIGFADTLEDTPKNKDLALKRAEYIKNVLLKAGISPEQLEVKTVFDVPSLWNEKNASYNNSKVLFRL